MKLVYQCMAIFFNFSPTSIILYPLQVEHCGSNSRLVVDEDDNDKFRLERVNVSQGGILFTFRNDNHGYFVINFVPVLVFLPLPLFARLRLEIKPTVVAGPLLPQCLVNVKTRQRHQASTIWCGPTR